MNLNIVLTWIVPLSFCLYSLCMAIRTYSICHKSLKRIRFESRRLEEKIKETVKGKDVDNLNLIFTLAAEDTEILAKHLQKYRQDVFANKQIKRVFNIEAYLSPNVLIDYYGKRKLAESIQGLLTGIGIFGTFLGLVIGLFQLDMENLKSSIQQLVGGMHIAFTSSVAAIFCSLLWTYQDRKFLTEFYEELQSLVDTISEHLPIRNESDVLEEIVAQQKEEIDTMRSFFSDVLIPQLVSGVGEAIKEHLSPEVAKISHTVDEVAEFSTARQAEGIQQLVDKISGVFDITLDKQFRELGESMNKISDSQAQAAEQLQDLLEYFEAQTREQATLVEQTKELLTQLRGCLVNLRDSHTYLSENVEHLNLIHGRLSTLQGDMNNWVSSINAEQTRLQQLREEQTEIINRQISSMNQSWDSISSGVADLNKTLGDSVATFSNNIHEGLNDTFNIFDEHLTSIAKTLAATIDELNLTVESLPNSFKALQLTLQDFDSQSKKVMSRFIEHEKTVGGEFAAIKDKMQEQNGENIQVIKAELDNKMNGIRDEVKDLVEDQLNKKPGLLSVFKGGKSS